MAFSESRGFLLLLWLQNAYQIATWRESNTDLECMHSFNQNWVRCVKCAVLDAEGKAADKTISLILRIFHWRNRGIYLVLYGTCGPTCRLRGQACQERRSWGCYNPARAEGHKEASHAHMPAEGMTRAEELGGQHAWWAAEAAVGRVAGTLSKQATQEPSQGQSRWGLAHPMKNLEPIKYGERPWRVEGGMPCVIWFHLLKILCSDWNKPFWFPSTENESAKQHFHYEHCFLSTYMCLVPA